MKSTSPITHVMLDASASDAEVDAVRGAFERYGLEPPIDADFEVKSSVFVPWLIHVFVDKAFPLFVEGMIGGAGISAWTLLQRLAKDLISAREPSSAERGNIVFEDPDATSVVLPSRLPQAGYDDLETVNWPKVTGHYLIWDSALGWREPGRGD